MALEVELSAAARRRLCAAVAALGALHLALALALVALGLWAPSSFHVQLLPAERQLIRQSFQSVSALGAAAAGAQALGLRALPGALRPHRHPRAAVPLALWGAAGAAVAAAEAVAAAAAPGYARALASQLRRTLQRGMASYLTDPRWKAQLDELQQRRGCCGAERAADWERTAWLQPQHLRPDSRAALLYTEVDGRVLPPVVPFSCCAPGPAPPCLHDPLQQARVRGAWEARAEAVRASLRGEGCAQVLARPLRAGLLAAAAALAVAAVAQVASLVCARLLYVSARNAALRGAPGGAGWAWLVGRGDLCLPCGRSLRQLDDEREQRRRLQAARRRASELRRAKTQRDTEPARRAGSNITAAWEQEPGDSRSPTPSKKQRRKHKRRKHRPRPKPPSPQAPH